MAVSLRIEQQVWTITLLLGFVVAGHAAKGVVADQWFLHKIIRKNLRPVAKKCTSIMTAAIRAIIAAINSNNECTSLFDTQDEERAFG